MIELAEIGRHALLIAAAIQGDLVELSGPLPEGQAADSDLVVYRSLVAETRSYIQAVANQINGTYERGWYDACAVMVRRLIETLIIEMFEAMSISGKIKNNSGDFLFLRDLINKCLDEKSWNLSRNCKDSLRRLKDIGDKSAHSRRFIAHKNDIEPLRPDIRVVVQELISIADIKQKRRSGGG
jgi:hypothetical protein